MHKTQSPEPRWLDFADAGLVGVRALFAPVSPIALRDARKAARKAVVALPDPTPAEITDVAAFAFSEALIRACLRGWEGIAAPKEDPADDADDVELVFSPEGVAVFLADPPLFDAADVLFVTAYVQRDAEKNASSASPPGTAAAAGKPTAKGASRPGAAKSAPTKSTSRARTPGNPPGK